MSREHVLLFGLGGIGGIYACILHLSGKCDVSVVARSNFKAVSEKGFRLKSPKFGDHSSIKLAGVLCANKALLDSKPSLSDNLRPVVTPNLTSIVLLQNGVGAEDPLHASFPDTTIISAVVWTGGRTLPEEGGVPGAEQFNREALTIGVDYRDGGDAKEEDAKLEKLVSWLRAGKGDCNVVKDIQSERWIKVIWNCCWNSLTTVTRIKTNRIFESSPGALPLCYTLMREVEAVAKAKGLAIPDGTVERLIKECTDVPTGLPSSMMFDNFAGRPMETEVILGTPLKEGQRLGVPVPTLLTLYTIVKALDYGNAHPDLCKI